MQKKFVADAAAIFDAEGAADIAVDNVVGWKTRG